jgi:hypothetical protein
VKPKNLPPAKTMFDVLRGAQGLADEVARRRTRPGALSVHAAPAASPQNELLAAPGTATAFIGRKDNATFRQLVRLLDNEKPIPAGFLDATTDEARKRRPVALATAFARAKKEPVLAHLSYRGSRLAEYIFVPEEFGLVTLQMPYIGGRLNEDKFEFVTFQSDDAPYELGCVVVYREATLTSSEVRARSLARDMNPIGPAVFSPNPFSTCEPEEHTNADVYDQMNVAVVTVATVAIAAYATPAGVVGFAAWAVGTAVAVGTHHYLTGGAHGDASLPKAAQSGNANATVRALLDERRKLLLAPKTPAPIKMLKRPKDKKS